MVRQRAGIIPAFALLITALQAQNFTTFTEWPVPMPGEIVASGRNGAYFESYPPGKLGFLDMNKNVVTLWTLPSGWRPLGVTVQGQRVAFAETATGHIALLDPNSATLTAWAVPQIESYPPEEFHIAVQGKYIFFSDWNQGVVGMLDTSTNQMTLWPMPGAPYRAPDGIALAGSTSSLQVWIADETGKISMLNPATNTFSDWPVPNQMNIPNLAITSSGLIVFNDYSANFIGTLNPSANLFNEWTIPTPNSFTPEVAVLSPTVAAFAEAAGNKVGTLDLTSTPNFVAAAAPAVLAVTPTIRVVIPTVTGLTETISTVTPTVTPAGRIVTGGFFEYLVPMAGSGPVTLTVNSNGAIIFSEYSGSRIGLLQ